MAALIKTKTGIEPEVIPGGRGEFTVWVEQAVVAKKDAHGFPAEEDVLASVQQALAHD